MSQSPTATHRVLISLLTLLSLLGVSRGAALTASAVLWFGAAPSPVQANAGEADKEYWQQRYRDLKAQVANLTEELKQARASYSRKRHERRLRGETRTELLAHIEYLDKELAKAERELQEFPDRARRAGALPGWFRDG